MAEIKVGTKLQSLRNGLIATVTEVNEKYKTALVDLSDGTNHSYSLATLKDKRAWVITEDHCSDGRSYAEIGKEIAKEAKAKSKANANATLVPMPGAEKLTELKQEVSNTQSDMIDKVVLSKFVKKAQKMITQAVHDNNGYHITVNVNGKEIFYHDKNLQNIRAALGHIYRGEAEA